MLIKAATIFNATLTGVIPDDALPTYTPISSSEVRSEGFSPVFEGALVFRSHGHMLLKYTIEKKIMPKAAIDAVAKAKADELEEQQGFRPGKKATKELKERAFDELLPRALSVPKSFLIWIDTMNHRLIIGSTVNDQVDSAIKALLKVEGLGLDITSVQNWPIKQLSEWLKDFGDNVPDNFTVDDAASVVVPGGAEITYRKADLWGVDIANRLDAGAQVTKVAMTYNERVSFVMTQGAQLRSIRSLDVLKQAQAVPDVDGFENDFMLTALELSAVINALLEQTA